jgi:NHS family xanthosine MFS transporter
MYLLAPMLGRFGLRNLLLVAIAASLLRYGFFAANQSVALIVGVLLHGICFTFFFIPAQIYIEQHVPKSMRFRAQAMMTLLVGGCGNLLGFLGCGWLRNICVTTEGITDWPTYWSLLNTAILAALLYFIWEWRKGPPCPSEQDAG